jgi:hypothetical protein
MTLNVVQMKSFFYTNTMKTRKKMKNDNIKQSRQKRSWYLDNQTNQQTKTNRRIKRKMQDITTKFVVILGNSSD